MQAGTAEKVARSKLVLVHGVELCYSLASYAPVSCSQPKGART